MQIGGEDLVLERPTSPDDWAVIQREFHRWWPDAVFSDEGEGEWFVYRDQEGSLREFAADEVPNGFVHVILRPDCLTFVVDDEETEARRVGRAIFDVMRVPRDLAPGQRQGRVSR